MANDAAVWTAASLGELGEFRNGVNFSRDDYGDGFPIVNVKQLYSGRYADVQDLLEVKPSAISNIDAVLLQYGDILFARSSVKASGAGQVAMVGLCPLNAVFSGFIIRFRIKATDRAVPEFLNYLLRSPFYRELLTRIGSGTTITNLSQSTLAGLQVKLPPVNEQQAIAHILGALDDKIELNRRMNETLEGMARAIFKSWFVDFLPVRAKQRARTQTGDPVRAKCRGEPLCSPPGLAPHIADLFPDAFEESELGEIPKGWRVCAVNELAQINEQSLGKGDPLDLIDYVEISKVMRGEISEIVRYERGTEPSRARRRLRHGDTVVSTVRPDRGAHFLCLDPPETLIASTGFAVLSPKDGYWAFLYTALTRCEIGETLGRLADGGAYPAIRPEAVGNLTVTVPGDPQLIQVFESIAEPLYQKSARNRDQSRTLAALRDALLPKLISGELRVPDAERIVRRCV